MTVEIVGHSISDDGHLAVVFSNDSLAVIHDPPPTTAVALEAAAHFLPGREPFLIRRSRRIRSVVYVHPADAVPDPLSDEELSALDAALPRLESIL